VTARKKRREEPDLGLEKRKGKGGLDSSGKLGGMDGGKGVCNSAIFLKKGGKRGNVQLRLGKGERGEGVASPPVLCARNETHLRGRVIDYLEKRKEQGPYRWAEKEDRRRK